MKLSTKLRGYIMKIDDLLDEVNDLCEKEIEYDAFTKRTRVSHRQFTSDLNIIRKELSYREKHPLKYYTGYETESIEFYHPKWPSFVLMMIVKDYNASENKWIKTYYEHENMVELIKFYAEGNKA